MRLTPQVRALVCVEGAAVERSGYRWVLVGALALTVTTSYGVLMYAFPIMLAPMQAELGWSSTFLTGGFSAGALAAGAAALPVGRWIDRYGPRVVMTTGSTTAAVLLLVWSRVHDPVSYVLVWVGLGACTAAVFYEPAFAVVAQWFQTRRARALAIITFAGGLASTIFVPLASWLVHAAGWRTAVVWLAVALGVLTILPHALLPRSRPPPEPPRDESRDSPARIPHVRARDALRTAAFRWIGAAFFLSTLASFAVAVHLVPMLLERGHPTTVAASALALLGLAKLPGRLLLAPVATRLSARTTIMWTLAVQAAALVILGTVEAAIGLWIFIALFGAGDGATTPARAELLAELFGSVEYGRIGGTLAFVLSLARAAAPIGASLGRAALGDYNAVLCVLVLILAGAAVAMARVRRDGRTCLQGSGLSHSAM